MKKLWVYILQKLGILCECGGLLQKVNGWDKVQCIKCYKTFRW